MSTLWRPYGWKRKEMMIMKYYVTLIKKETYEVEAENEEAAFELACGLADDDYMAFSEPVDEFIIEEIK